MEIRDSFAPGEEANKAEPTCEDCLAFTPEQLAAALCIPVADVHWLMDTGQLIPILIKGTCLILADDVRALLRTYQAVQLRKDYKST